MLGRALCRLGLHADRLAYRFRDSRRLILACTRCGRYRTKGV